MILRSLRNYDENIRLWFNVLKLNAVAHRYGGIVDTADMTEDARFNIYPTFLHFIYFICVCLKRYNFKRI